MMDELQFVSGVEQARPRRVMGFILSLQRGPGLAGSPDVTAGTWGDRTERAGNR